LKDKYKRRYRKAEFLKNIEDSSLFKETKIISGMNPIVINLTSLACLISPLGYLSRTSDPRNYVTSDIVLRYGCVSFQFFSLTLVDLKSADDDRIEF
jgi:hypothetical protein